MSRTVHGDASLLVGWSYGWIRGVTWFGLNVFLATGCGVATMVESIGELVVWTSKIFDVVGPLTKAFFGLCLKGLLARVWCAVVVENGLG